jgi:hypothetical protein
MKAVVPVILSVLATSGASEADAVVDSVAFDLLAAFRPGDWGKRVEVVATGTRSLGQ